MPIGCDGFIYDGIIIWNEPDTRGWAACGLEVEAPSVQHAGAGELNELHRRLEQMLSTVKRPDRMQALWTVNTDFSEPLERYRRETDKLAVNEWSKFNREERYSRYARRMRERTLRRERLRVFYSTPIKSDPPKASVFSESFESHYRNLVALYVNYFGTLANALQASLGENFTVKRLDSMELVKALDEFINPSHKDLLEYDPFTRYDMDKSILENLLCGEWDARDQDGAKADYGIWRDGHYEQILVVKMWCQNVSPDIMQRLTNMPFLDYSITVNIEPLDIQEEINRQETLLKRIKGDDNERKAVAIEIKRARIKALQKGYTFPLKCLFAIRVWHPRKDELTVRVNHIKTSVALMQGMQLWELANATSTRNMILSTMPGWLFSTYNGHARYAENTYMCDLLPFSGSFTGRLQDAMALYDGNAHNLVGISPVIDGTPQHCAILGAAGAGKSLLMNDILTQTEPYFDYTVIIEEGLSYGTYTQAMGCSPLIIHLDSEFTINYLDTCGNPLMSSHLKSVSALASSLCGELRNDETSTGRRALLSKYIGELYMDSYKSFIRRNENLKPEIARLAVACERMRETMPEGTSNLEAYIVLRDGMKANDERTMEIHARVSEREISDLMGRSEIAMRNMAYAFMTPEDMPVHSHLAEMIELLHGMDSEIRASYASYLGDTLNSWRRGGPNGSLIDGVTNIDISGRVTHFELGQIPESATDLKIVVARMIDQLCRSRIISMPRNQRKRYVFEEMGRFMLIPGGEEIISEGYSQMRKFNCWNVSVTQQYARFKDTKVGAAIMGNSSMFLLLRQNDRSDVEKLQETIGFSDRTGAAILNYPKPESLPANNKHSAFTYFHSGARRPIVGTATNYVTPEMFYVANSSGDLFQKRSQEIKDGLAQGKGMMEIIRNNSSKTTGRKDR